MKLNFCAAALCAALLSACGGGGGTTSTTAGGALPVGGGGSGPVAITTTTSNFVSPNGVAVDGVVPDGFTVENAVGVGGTMQFVTVNGNVRPMASGLGLPFGVFSDGSSTLYGASFSSDGNSSALAGWRAPTLGAGAFVRAVPGANLTGSANYSGAYTGYMADDPTFGKMNGTMNVSANFDSGQFSARISGRQFTGSTFSTLFDLPKIQSDVAFGGTIDSQGVFCGGHDDGNSVGSLTGMAHPSGVLGVVEVTHAGGGSQFSFVTNPVEVGTFNAE